LPGRHIGRLAAGIRNLHLALGLCVRVDWTCIRASSLDLLKCMSIRRGRGATLQYDALKNTPAPCPWLAGASNVAPNVGHGYGQKVDGVLARYCLYHLCWLQRAPLATVRRGATVWPWRCRGTVHGGLYERVGVFLSDVCAPSPRIGIIGAGCPPGFAGAGRVQMVMCAHRRPCAWQVFALQFFLSFRHNASLRGRLSECMSHSWFN